MPGLELTTELKREAAAILQSKSGATSIPQQPPSNSQIPPNDQFRTGNRLGSVGLMHYSVHQRSCGYAISQWLCPNYQLTHLESRP